MKEAIDTSPSRRQVLRLAAMVTACAVAAKATNAAEPLKGDSYVPADGISTFESVWQTVRDRFYDPRHNGSGYFFAAFLRGAEAALAECQRRLKRLLICVHPGGLSRCRLQLRGKRCLQL